MLLRRVFLNFCKQPCRAVSFSQEKNSSKVEVSRKLSLADEPVDIVLSGLKPQQKITLHASVTLPSGPSFESFSHYAADGNGFVDLSGAESQGGTYQGIEPMGPLWSMVPSPFNKKKFERLVVKDPSHPFTVSFSIYDNFHHSLEGIGLLHRDDALAGSVIERTYMSPGVQVFEIMEGRLRATLFLPPGKGPFPGIISISGGYPGAMKHKAALLASRGFAALAVRYFGTDEFPPHFFDTDLLYFEEAAFFLKNHPMVAGSRGVGIIANCLGGSIALALSGVAPPGLVNCVAITNSIFCIIGYFRYKNVKFEFPPGFEWLSSKGPRGSTVWTYVTDIDITNPEHVHPFHEQHDISYMFIFGGEDGHYNGEQSARFAKTLFAMSGHENNEILFYPKAGHFIEHAYLPFANIVPTLNVPLYGGGRQPWNARAAIDSWPRILSFVHNSLVKSV